MTQVCLVQWPDHQFQTRWVLYYPSHKVLPAVHADFKEESTLFGYFEGDALQAFVELSES